MSFKRDLKAVCIYIVFCRFIVFLLVCVLKVDKLTGLKSGCLSSCIAVIHLEGYLLFRSGIGCEVNVLDYNETGILTCSACGIAYDEVTVLSVYAGVVLKHEGVVMILIGAYVGESHGRVLNKVKERHILLVVIVEVNVADVHSTAVH